MARLEDHSEVELKLTVVGDDPAGLLDAVAALDRLGDDPLGPVRRHRLRDVYWDTPNTELRQHGLTLRLREMDGAPLFTVKGGTSASDGLFRRHELELAATAENWQAVREVLAAAGLRLADRAASTDLGDRAGSAPRRDDRQTPARPAPVTPAREATSTGHPDDEAAPAGSPADWLAAAGLVVRQDRTTDRRAREVLRDGRPVAELALDHTTFRFRSLTVEYREIEVEQLGEQDIDLHAFRLALTSRFPDRLEPSTMGKYSRGLALERQLRSAGLL